MPELRRVWLGVDTVLARNAEVFAQDALALDWAADTALESVRTSSEGGQVEVSRQALRSLPRHVIRLVLRRAAMAAGRSQPPPKVRLDAAMDFCLSRRGGGRMSIGAGVEVLRGYDTLLFKCEQHGPERILGSVELEPPCAVDIPGIYTTLKCRVIRDLREVESVRNSFPTDDADTAFVDLATVGEPLGVRGRRRGDRLRPLGGSGEVTLTKFLIERRIPSWERDSVPIVARASGIVWVAGLEIDSRHRVTDRTSNVLELRIVDIGRRPEGEIAQRLSE
jgi:tRNA(Ile)-lysidine synthase